MGVGVIPASFRNNNNYMITDRIGKYTFEFIEKNEEGSLNF